VKPNIRETGRVIRKEDRIMREIGAISYGRRPKIFFDEMANRTEIIDRIPQSKRETLNAKSFFSILSEILPIKNPPSATPVSQLLKQNPITNSFPE